MEVERMSSLPHAGSDPLRWAITDKLDLGLDNAPCDVCGRQIEALPPLFQRPDGRIGTRTQYGDMQLCMGCRVRALPFEQQGVVEAGYKAILQAAALAGIPSQAPVWSIAFAADSSAHKALRGFRGRFLGIQVGGLPKDLSAWPGMNVMCFAIGDGERSIDLLIYETEVWHDKIPAASLIFRSHPASDGMISETRRPGGRTHAELARLARGFALYSEAAELHARRPPGVRTWSKEDFLFELPRVRQKLRTRNGRKPTDLEIATDMGISSATFYRYKRQFLRDPE
jgi:hypothetical protein